MLPSEYLSARPSIRIGLARVASLAMRRQQEAGNSLLLDNGVFLLGNPLGIMLSTGPVTAPAIRRFGDECEAL